QGYHRFMQPTIAAAAFMLGVLMILAMNRASGDDHTAQPLPKPAIDLPTTRPGEMRTAVLAGGCFWCTEGAFRQFRGVNDVVSGYAGDSKETANYKTVCSGATHHAEAIKITY